MNFQLLFNILKVFKSLINQSRFIRDNPLVTLIVYMEMRRHL